MKPSMLKEVGPRITHVPTPRKPEVEEMEVVEVAAQFSQQLCIEDIDTLDYENPQLCAEYVKEIYEYMMLLEVS